MILIFTSSNNNTQAGLIEKSLHLRSFETKILNTHNLSKSNLSFGFDKELKKISINNRPHKLQAIIFINHPRIDCILDVPRNVLYPNEWRLRNEWFLKEFCDFFNDTQFFPTRLSDINIGESKLRILFEAQRLGLIIPGGNIINFYGNNNYLFEKPIGFPFCVTNKRKSSREVCVTSFGSTEKTSRHNYPTLKQAPIKASKHVRCFVTLENVYSVARDVKQNEELVDFRLLNENEDFKPIWNDFKLSAKVETYLKNLLRSLNLQWASPEFLIDHSGQEFFIDLNPCGDWFGFFNDQTNQIIVSEITNIVCSSIR